MSAPSTVVVDCRWLGIGGPGRTTELMLRGLAEDPPSGRWVLWGDEVALRGLAWPGAEVVQIAADPRLLLGQRHLLDVPKGDVVLFMHQQRPLYSRTPSVTVIYDTIALRHGTTPPVRRLKREFLRKVARDSRHVLTISEHSRSSIVRDLGVPSDRVRVLHFPFDDSFVGRVDALRAAEARQDVALYVGGFLPHKNLDRLVAAFAATEFSHDGGRLVLVGGTRAQADQLLRNPPDGGRSVVSVRPRCNQAELDRLFATSLFLVQPSLEEGFGLPAWEAICCGLPVCVSDGGALPEVADGFADPFPATSTSAMAAALDACASTARTTGPADLRRSSARARERAPGVRDFGARFRAILEERASSTT